MSLFPHFNSAQIWMVLVNNGGQSQRLETWLAPEGQEGVRRIFRHTHPDKRPIAAIPLPRLGVMGLPASGVREALNARMRGPEQAVFIMDGDDGICRLAKVRGRSPQDAVRKSGSAAVGGFYLDLVRTHAWTMRRLLDQQKMSEAEVNLLRGDGLPTVEADPLVSRRAPLWTRQMPGENDLDEA